MAKITHLPPSNGLGMSDSQFKSRFKKKTKKEARNEVKNIQTKMKKAKKEAEHHTVPVGYRMTATST